MPTRIESFNYQDQELSAEYQETVEVIPGKVFCDVYTHPETQERDLGIISISAGANTPVQRVILGEETIEGYLSGKGKLIVIHNDGSIAEYPVDETTEGFTCSIWEGQTMQWQADSEEPLEIFEICYPPFEEGRFESISQEKL